MHVSRFLCSLPLLKEVRCWARRGSLIPDPSLRFFKRSCDACFTFRGFLPLLKEVVRCWARYGQQWCVRCVSRGPGAITEGLFAWIIPDATRSLLSSRARTRPITHAASATQSPTPLPPPPPLSWRAHRASLPDPPRPGPERDPDGRGAAEGRGGRRRCRRRLWGGWPGARPRRPGELPRPGRRQPRHGIFPGPAEGGPAGAAAGRRDAAAGGSGGSTNRSGIACHLTQTAFST